MAKRRFFLAAGHGGADPGAVAGGTNERTENIRVVAGAAAILRSQDLGETELVIVPHDLARVGEAAYVNSHMRDPGRDLCLAVHQNSNAGSPGTGTETYYGAPALANEIHREIAAHLGLRDRGVKNGRFLYWNAATKPASALLEMGFINNPADLQRVRERGPEALARAIVRAVGATWREGATGGEPAPQPPALPPAPADPKKEAARNLISEIRNLCDRIDQLLR